MIDETKFRALVEEAVRKVLREERALAAEDGFLTTAEAAAEARVDEGTIRDWVKAGHLSRNTTGRGGRLRIRRSELVNYLAAEKARRTGAGVTPIEAARRAFDRRR